MYWASLGKSLSFGSSAVSVRKLLFNDYQTDESKVKDFIAYSITTTGNCFKNVQALHPGRILIFKEGVVDIISIPESSNCSSIEEQLEKAIFSRIIPKDTGLAFSSGLDSSLIK